MKSLSKLSFSQFAQGCRFLIAVALVLGSATIASAQKPEEATRLMVGLKSTDQVLSDLEYLVANLAGKKESYEDNVYLNIEVFAFGVAWDRVVRFDSVFDEKHGRQLFIAVPLEDLETFFLDNLEPIGIDPVKQRDDTKLYRLTGNVFEGWLRYLPEPVPYAAIFPQKEYLPANMAHPQKEHEELEKEGSVAFLLLENDAEGIADRQAAFKTVRTTVMEDFQKTPDESKDEYALRKRAREHTLTLLEQWLVESEFAKIGVKVDQEKHQAPTSLTFRALPDTPLGKAIERINEPRYFGAIAVPEESVLSVRGNIPIDEGHQATYKEIYDLTRPVVKERIDEIEGSTDAERAARHEAMPLLLDVLTETVALGKIDGFLDVTGDGNAHTLTMGVVAAGHEKIVQIIEALPKIQEGWTLEKDVDKVGELAIHKIALGDDVPKALTDFYGTSNEAFVAVSEDAFWLGFGADALAAIKTQIETVSNAESVEPDNLMLSSQMHAHPVLKNVHSLVEDSDVEFLKLFQSRGATRGSRSGDEERRERAQALADFEWEETAIQALEGEDDRVHFEIKRTAPYELSGSSNAEKGFLKALGAVIAKFADENLRG